MDLKMARDERRMTFIIVPHGGRDLNTRSFEVSYRRVRMIGIVLLVALVVWLLMAVSWIFISGQAARVPMLQREVSRLQSENAQVAQLADALRRLEAQYDQVRAMLGADRAADPGSIWLPPSGENGARSPATPAGDSTQAHLPTQWPLTARGFVTREHLGRIPGQHPGIDIAVAEGSYVRAAGAGIVEEAGADEVYGNFIRIRHAGGFQSVYGHASELFVATTDSVERHEVIALSGNTGTSTAPHLHFEIWKDGQPIDPRTQVTQPLNRSP
jgi:murein DD-endopeptidase MepM/ murein hydrolase activator NlpD